MAIRTNIIVEPEFNPITGEPMTVVRGVVPGVPEAIISEPVTINDAYVLIVSVIADKSCGKAEVTFVVRTTPEANVSAVCGKFEMPFDARQDTPNLWTQAYTHLKTMPQFEEAEDC